MTSETAFIEALRALATHEAARGLVDDAAVIEMGGVSFVLTSDTIVAGVHFLATDPPEDVGWKLAAVNLSDLAAKGARPLACLMNYALTGDEDWDKGFLSGLKEALDSHAMPLIGGDTVALPKGAPGVYTLTAIGEGPACGVPSRAGAHAGDILCVTGNIGDAGLGLALARRGGSEPASCLRAYRRPKPLLADGQALAPLVHAMMDVSDGVLIDASRMAVASGLHVEIAVDRLPLSPEVLSSGTDELAVRLSAATAGDDYQLLFAVAPGTALPITANIIGRFEEGQGLTLSNRGSSVPVPPKLGYLHC
ncbi:thiamine-phosphate kinase [Rhizorhapis suberifaciens]|uniref:Thiamine-monophosphate kinase n=1 Tax=Rhizorhapis suberifaciens TaxID=13656 RepID=A0A840HSB9_9SPHN|nr:thiamine-phosphate kinase [Rhizorhapis suberifaciens]MBB4640470.1 thiamine-monophosphate kinase [Rhizorhapis suberifaciens]